MKASKGFTLVEILIVVVILGILAAIVIPQFTEASTEAKQSRLMSDLQTMRSQVELYKVQHSDTVPAVADFTTSMTTSDGTYGPYLQKVPTNPFVDGTGNAVGAEGAADVGWHYDPNSGAIHAADADHEDL
jgi:general secretion pathway protein G